MHDASPAARQRSVLAALIAALLTLLTAARGTAQGDDRTLRVFIFAGQSNMVGSDSQVGDIERFPPFVGLAEPQPGVRFSYCIGREDKHRSDGWVSLQPVDGVVGPELSFARDVTRAIKAPIAIIKVAAGGTHLDGDWNPDAPRGFAMYPLALAHVRAALADLERRKVRYRLEGFMWHQGENDMFEPGAMPKYGANLERFLARWRRDLDAPGLRFYIGELCTKTIWGMDLRSSMHAISVGQREVTDVDPLADYVPTSHIGVEIGGGVGLHYHYGTLGQLEHGVNYAEAYLRTLGVAHRAARRLATWPYPKASSVKLFILAGHRNMEGERAFVQDLRALGKPALAQDNPKIAYKYDVGGGYRVSDGWEPLGPAGGYDTFGPELSFGKRLAGKERGGIAIAKFTHSGSQIIDWTPAGSEAVSRNLYPKFLAFVRGAIDDLEARGHAVEVAGVFYHLGENDMSYAPFRADAVGHLSAWIAAARQDLDLPELRWFVSQQRPTDDESVNQVDVTAALKRLISADPHTFRIDAFELPGQEQQLVLTTAGVLALGEALADGYLKAR